jgi:hypothetical protein
MTMATVSDCSEVYRTGFKLKRFYKIDPTGSNDLGSAKPAYCDNGWTHILRRMPDEGGKVINISN